MPVRQGQVSIRPASTTARPPGSMTVHAVASVPPRSAPPPSLRPPPVLAGHDELVGGTLPSTIPESFLAPDPVVDPRLLPPPSLAAGAHAAHHARRPHHHAQQERQLPVVVQMALAALTAGLVVAIGLFVIEANRRDPVVVQAQAPAPVAQAPQPAEPTRTEPVESPKSPAPPRRDSDPVMAVKPKIETADIQAVPVERAPDTSVLSPQEGYLTVKGPAMADVYLNGMHRGPTNRPLRVACGAFYLRLAPPDPGRFPAWIGPGETVSIPCRAATVFTSKLAIQPPAEPSETGSGPRGTGL
jgi:hypothetical protein